jgi:prolyl-tRNA synthetase
MADGAPVGALIRGDRDLNEGKLRRLLGANLLRMMEPDEIERLTGAPVGFSGPVALPGVKLLLDFELKPLRDFVTGANKDETHLVHVCHGRDFRPDEWADLRVAVAGDPSPGGGVLSEVHGIEVGHIFQLGVKYSESMGADFVDAAGEAQPVLMGCYGLGISRCMQAVAEVHNDEDGLIWPCSVAPYHVVVIPAGPEEKVNRTADGIHAALVEQGVEALIDDRDERAGVKFKDADLVGWPVQIIVGQRVADGKVEVGLRRDKSRREVPIEAGAQAARDLLERELAALMPA